MWRARAYRCSALHLPHFPLFTNGVEGGFCELRYEVVVDHPFGGCAPAPYRGKLHFINRSLKLALDVLLGAVVPILILSYLSDPLGAVPAYLLSALIPVGWVLVDLFFVSRRFNFITAFLGLNAIVRGLLAFWFVDGALYALKDTVGSILIVVVFGGSLLLGHPLLGAFVAQALDPRTPCRRLR